MPRRLIHKAQVLTKQISLNPNLDLSQITQTLLRSVGESSKRLINDYFRGWNQQLSKGGDGKAFILFLKN
jgi:hypothetical protein